MKTKESFFLRRALPEDAGTISELLNSAYRGESSKVGWTTEADLVGGERATPETVGALINETHSHFILAVATDSLEIIGCVHVLVEDDFTVYFGMLAVRPALQTFGIGKALIRAVEAFAEEKRKERIRITVINFRPELIAYYQRLGFSPTGKVEAFPNPHFIKVHGVVLQEFVKNLR